MHLPVYHCHRRRGEILIDGHVDETAWERADEIEFVLADTAKPPRQRTRARMLWDEKALYVAFICEDDDIWGITTERDQDIYNQEVVELFIDADGDGHTYIEIEVSPLNAVLDLFMLYRQDRRKGLWNWNSEGLVSAVYVDGDPWHRQTVDRLWSVELALPFKDVFTAPHIPPELGDIWRVNLYRIDRSAQGDEYSAWSPPGRLNYHTPWRFGKLVFVD